jgi:hypothetical protein
VGGVGAIKIGSEEHKALFCREFVKTHDPFEPSRIDWPELDEPTLARLKALPIWNEAVQTETETALKVQTLGKVEPDPVLAEAIALQGFEEGRHAAVLRLLTSRYGIRSSPSRSRGPRRGRSGPSSRPATASASTPSSPSGSSLSASGRSTSRSR